MKKWKLTYYSQRVYKEIFSLPEDILGSYVFISEMMETEGPNIGLPHTRAMRDKLFEIRVSGREGIARIFYCTGKQKKIWILHSFKKKTQETPLKELTLARKRLKEVMEYD
ncbi:MAG: phage derived protein Gp49-like protein [Gammaproteobacteria bacterium]|jgi:phage-related protein|nr:phage derived protein Gp49-like protein [Gammaproteobacteria bacterium]